VKAYESKAGEKTQAAQIARSKVADEHLSGADKFVVVTTFCESKTERRDLTSRVSQLEQPFKRGKNLKDGTNSKERRWQVRHQHGTGNSSIQKSTQQ